jgi:hypothetical protein
VLLGFFLVAKDNASDASDFYDRAKVTGPKK